MLVPPIGKESSLGQYFMTKKCTYPIILGFIIFTVRVLVIDICYNGYKIVLTGGKR
jgi:hypothetical protein